MILQIMFYKNSKFYNISCSLKEDKLIVLIYNKTFFYICIKNFFNVTIYICNIFFKTEISDISIKNGIFQHFKQQCLLKFLYSYQLILMCI